MERENYMSVQISQEQQYINAVMAKLPEIKSKKVHTLKTGDSLWSLAKESLGKKASNQEISMRMLMIAKLNNLTTIEQMNNLKATEKIYLPETYIETAKKEKVLQKELNSSEKSALDILSTLQNDKTITLEDAFSYSTPGVLYHVYNKRKDSYYGYVDVKRVVGSISMGKDGKIKDISFNDTKKHFNPWGFDYALYRDGTIINRYTKEPCGKLTDKQMKEFLETGHKIIDDFREKNNY